MQQKGRKLSTTCTGKNSAADLSLKYILDVNDSQIKWIEICQVELRHVLDKVNSFVSVYM